jgi:hypothetical protein
MVVQHPERRPLISRQVGQHKTLAAHTPYHTRKRLHR